MSILSSNQTPSFYNEEIHLSTILDSLWGGRRIIFLSMISSLALGFLFVYKQVPQYQSEILLQIKSNSSMGLASNLSQQLNFDAGRNDAEATQIALIKSRFVLAPVVTTLGLDIQAVPKQSYLMKLLFPSHAKIKIKQFDIPYRETNKRFTLIFDKANHFKLYNTSKKFVLEGEVDKLATSNDNKIRLLVSDVQIKGNTAFSLTKVPDINVINSIRSQLKIFDLGENKQTGVLALTLNNSNPKDAMRILNEIGKTIQAKDIQKNALEASKTLEFLYQQLPITKHDLEKAESELNRYRARSGKIDIKLQAEYLLKQLTEIDKQLSELRIEEIDKLQHYTNQHPFIIALNTKIHELDVDKSRLEIQLKKLPASDQIAMNLFRDVKVKESLYTVLLKKIQELQVTKAGIVSDVRILSVAKPPRSPLPLRRNLIYLASLFFGFMLSTSFVFLRKIIFPCVNDPHWGEKQLGLTNLAIIPYSKEQFPGGKPLKGKSLAQLPLLAQSNPKNLAIEALRSLRTSLQVRLSCEPNNIVAIMGIAPGVGKTFVSANLAYLLAAAGKRVVVVDTDMRRGTLHKYYNIQPAPGLSELLNNMNALEQVLMPTAHENLRVLPRGTYPKDPSELLAGEQFKSTLNVLSQQFDVVVIDTPPVLLVTDGVLISVHAGTNYLVVGANAHQPNEIEISIKRLQSAGVVLNGTIFNFHKQTNTGNSGYGYGYKYGSYYDDKETT